jgi:hypothetical protein
LPSLSVPSSASKRRTQSKRPTNTALPIRDRKRIGSVSCSEKATHNGATLTLPRVAPLERPANRLAISPSQPERARQDSNL